MTENQPFPGIRSGVSHPAPGEERRRRALSKSLYSLILSDEVIARIDRLATRQGTNRSALVNRILAEYCSMVTPEKRIETVLGAVKTLLDGDGELAPSLNVNVTCVQDGTSLQ